MIEAKPHGDRGLVLETLKLDYEAFGVCGCTVLSVRERGVGT